MRWHHTLKLLAVSVPLLGAAAARAEGDPRAFDGTQTALAGARAAAETPSTAPVALGPDARASYDARTEALRPTRDPGCACRDQPDPERAKAQALHDEHEAEFLQQVWTAP